MPCSSSNHSWLTHKFVYIVVEIFSNKKRIILIGYIFNQKHGKLVFKLPYFIRSKLLKTSFKHIRCILGHTSWFGSDLYGWMNNLCKVPFLATLKLFCQTNLWKHHYENAFQFEPFSNCVPSNRCNICVLYSSLRRL